MRVLSFLLPLFIFFTNFGQFKDIFIPNQNQWEASIRYKLSLNSRYNVYFQDSKLTFNVLEPIYKPVSPHSSKHTHQHNQPIDYRGHSFNLSFKDAKSKIQIEGQVKESYYLNYFIGSESHWAPDVPAYKKLVYKDLYSGIDLHFKPVGRALKSEFVLTPGADPNQIKIVYEGLDSLYLAQNQIYMVTNIGTLIEHPPFSYQISGGDTVEVKTVYRLENNILTYDFPEGYNSSLKLVIDPTLEFATLSGATDDNWGTISTASENGSVYSFGRMFGTRFVSVLGGFDKTFGGGNIDISIIKFNGAGRPLYATFLGGNSSEDALAARIDKNNDLVIFGITGSTNFPVTATAYQRVRLSGGNLTIFGDVRYFSTDMFITKVERTGNRILASTYLGGTNNDGLNEHQSFGFGGNYAYEGYSNLAFDASNNIYIASTTSSDNLAPGIRRGSLRGRQDGFAARFSADLSTLNWLTYIGGTDTETATDLSLASSGELVVVGSTFSFGLPLTTGTIGPSKKGSADAYIAILNSSSGVITKSTYLGTSNFDVGLSVGLDLNDNIVVMGQTEGDYPVSTGAYRFGSTSRKIFFHKLTLGLDRTVFSAVIRADFQAKGFDVDACGDLHLLGITSGDNLPTTSDAFQANRADANDLYYLHLRGDGTAIKYGTYYGGRTNAVLGDHVDGARMNINSDGNIAINNCSCNANSSFGRPTASFPTTPGAFAPNLGSDNCNQSMLRFSNVLLTKTDLRFSTSAIKSSCAPVTVTFTNNSTGRTNYTWDPGDGSPLVNSTNMTHTFRTPGTHIVRLRSECAKAAFDTITVHPSNIKRQADRTICVGDTVDLKIEGGTRYTWTPTTGLSAANIGNPRAFPNVSTTYFITIDNGTCTDFDTVTINVIQNLKVDFEAKVIETCDSLQIASITNNTVVNPPLQLDYIWTTEDGQRITGDLNQIKFRRTGSLLIKLEAGKDRCLKTDSVRLDIKENSRYLPFQTTGLKAKANFSCGVNNPIQLEAQGGARYVWTPTTGLSDPNIANPLANPSSTTTYKVRIINSAGCEIERTVTVEVPPQMELNFEAITVRESCKDIPSLEITDKSVNVSNYRWDFGDGTVSEAKNPSHTYQKAGKYTVKLTAKDARECVKDTAFQINLERPVGYNAFSPNGDGLNEVFDTGLHGWNIEIFNRWGNLVYKKENYRNNWSAEKQTAGTYYYVLVSPEGITCRGWVAVLK